MQETSALMGACISWLPLLETPSILHIALLPGNRPSPLIDEHEGAHRPLGSPLRRRRPLLFLRSLSLGGGLRLAPESPKLLLLLRRRESCSLAGVDLVLVYYPVPKGAIGDADLAGDPRYTARCSVDDLSGIMEI